MAFKSRQRHERSTDTHGNRKQHHGIRLLDRAILLKAPREQPAPSELQRHVNVGSGARSGTLLLRRARYRDRVSGVFPRANTRTFWVRGACVGCTGRLGQNRVPGDCARFTESCDPPPQERRRLSKRIFSLQLTTVTRGSDVPKIDRQDQDPSSRAAISVHRAEVVEYITTSRCEVWWDARCNFRLATSGARLAPEAWHGVTSRFILQTWTDCRGLPCAVSEKCGL